MARRTYPAINALRDFVKAELNKRKRGSLAVPTPTITPFVRMTSAIEDPNEHYRFFSMGLHGITDQELEGNLFELTYGNRDVVGFGYDTPGLTTETTTGFTGLLEVGITTTEVSAPEGQRFRRRPIQSTQSPDTREEVPAEGKHPIPGITNVSVNYKGINDVVEVVVSWKCYNATQLNFLRNHFLLFGRYVVIDFGHIISNRVNTEPLRPFDFGQGDAVVKLAQYEHGGRLAVVDGEGGLDPVVANNNGNYDIFIGKVTNSTINLQPDNTYNCTTTIVSTGEVIYGATHHSLVSDLGIKLDEEDKNEYLDTIEEFFKEGGTLDAEVGMATEQYQTNKITDSAGQPPVIDAFHRHRTRTGGSRRPGSVGLGLGSKLEADQYVFVSWNYFTHNIIPSMFALIHEQAVNSEIDLFTSIGQPIYDAAVKNNQRPGESEVGNHPILTSTDYKTLIIVNKQAVDADAEHGEDPPLFGSPVQIFADAAGSAESKGYLSKGVYLNVEAIKESFLNQRTFYDGMAALLRRVNNATANFWKLDIGFDEETKKVYIFDRGGSAVLPDYPNIPEPYIFNKGTEGELLELNFDASFSDEMKTSVMISARSRGDQDFGGTTIGARRSVAFGPDRHGHILGTDGLFDVLQKSINDLAIVRRRERLAQLGRTIETDREHAAQSRENARDAQYEQQRRRDEELSEISQELRKFNDELKWYIQLASTMKGKITAHALRHPEISNNYITPIATEITLQLTIMGISGIAFWDCFKVDKLPKVYGEHGVFLVNGISHDISRGGWTTKLNGLYYFIWQTSQQQAEQAVQEGTYEPVPTYKPLNEEIRESLTRQGAEAEAERIRRGGAFGRPTGGGR